MPPWTIGGKSYSRNRGLDQEQQVELVRIILWQAPMADIDRIWLRTMMSACMENYWERLFGG
jgi:hypothetical protein